MLKGRVQWRHILVYFLGGVLCWLFLFIWNRHHIRQFHVETTRQSLLHHARMMEVLFQVNESISDTELKELSKKIPYRITVIDREGNLLVDSRFSSEQLQERRNQREHAEIQAAARKGAGTDLRYDSRDETWHLFAAVELSNGRGFVRLSAPVRWEGDPGS